MEQTPQCVGFIMDGNRRWAKAKDLPTLEGHSQGYQALLNIVRATHNAGIPHMVCYAFSTENWKRTEEEVGYLMNLMLQALRELPKLLRDEGRKVNLHVIGERERLSDEIKKEIDHIESDLFEHPDLTVWVAISYGGRSEILRAVNTAIEKGDSVNETSFSELLMTHGMPDPDLIIRTSGEERLSNFLLWQSAYSELFFTETLWPDFGESEFKDILEQYGQRQRRRGA